MATWPDGTVSGRYGFRHALYQQVLYQQIAEARRIRLHRQIGERLEAGYGERAKEIAPELAMHFERGRDYERAVRYLHAGRGECHCARSAHPKPLHALTQGVDFVEDLAGDSGTGSTGARPAAHPRGGVVAQQGHGAPRSNMPICRAQALCAGAGSHPHRCSSTRGTGRSIIWRTASSRPLPNSGGNS